jgi:O-antigen/teichoic acid export membrane protein
LKKKIAVLRNVAWVAAAGYIESATGLLAGVLIARTLGPAEYGHYAFAIWTCGMLIMAGNNALPGSSIKFIAEARGSGRDDVAAALASRFTRLQVASSSLVLLVFAAAMAWQPMADWREHLLAMIGIAVVGVWSRAGFWMWGAVGKGHELFVPENVTLMLTALLNAAGVIALALAGATALQFFALYAALGVVSNLMLRRVLARCGVRPAPGPIPPELVVRLRRHLWLTAIVMLLAMGCSRMVEMTLLKAHTNAETVGYFAIAGSLTKGAVDLLAGGMAAVLLPAMSRRFGEGGRGALGGMLAESARLYWFAGLAIAGLGLTVCDGLVHLLYGHRYDGAIPVLMWSLVVAGLTVVSGAAAAVLVASDNQQDRVKVLSCTLTVNVAAGLWLIPRYGLNGAIASFALTNVADMAMNWVFALRRVKVRLPAGPLARQALAAAVATALGAEVVEDLHLSLAFAGGATVFLLAYLALCVRLRTFRTEEFELVAHLVGRLGPRARRMATHIAALQRYAIDVAAKTAPAA